VPARAHAQRGVHRARRGAEHDAGADEDVPHAHGLRREGGHHRRPDPDRPAAGAVERAARRTPARRGHPRHRHDPVHRRRRRPPPAGRRADPRVRQPRPRAIRGPRGGTPARSRDKVVAMLITTPDDLVNAVSRDRRLTNYRVRRQGDGWIELELVTQRGRNPVLLVLAWPDVWQDAAALQPHLIRARAGNYGLILVGKDDELEEARLDQPNDADLTALSLPIT